MKATVLRADLWVRTEVIVLRHVEPHALFAEVRAFFGAFTETALEQSSHLIDRIVERS